MTWKRRIAAVQMTATENLIGNLSACTQAIAQAAAEGAQIVTLPECFAFLGLVEGDKRAAAESLDGPPGRILSTLSNAASKAGVWIVGGGMPESVANDPLRTYNTAVVINAQGQLTARYRKLHLFDVDIPGGAVLKESSNTAAGDAVVVTEIAGVPMGLSICYDVRFPELYRQLTVRGAEVLLVPAAFTAHTGQAHWHLLLRARAVENQAWVVAPAQTGQHNTKRSSFGHSLVSNPWGDIVAELASGPGVIYADIDGDTVAQRRQQMPCLQHAKLL
ncbi:MAG: carbon-nitrogen hydrolase family protein [Kofleriaceae bacterium]|nr:carbon-nitrogen hydrolase family protein [Kofleriaceae bacterium]